MLSHSAVVTHLRHIGGLVTPPPTPRFVDGLDTELRRQHRLAQIRSRRDLVFSPVARRALGIKDES